MPVVCKALTGDRLQENFPSTYLMEDGYDIRAVQALLDHKDVKTKMVYIYVLNRGGKRVRNPLDGFKNSFKEGSYTDLYKTPGKIPEISVSSL